MRFTLKLFAFLDFICIVFLSMQLYNVWKNGLNFEGSMDTIRFAGMLSIYVLLFISMIGLFMGKKIGFIASYIQFPLRLWLWVFSLGFITFFPEALGRYEDYWFDWLFKACVVAEIFRLYFTIRFHKKLARTQW